MSIEYPDKLRRSIPGNIPDGMVRNQHLDLSNLPEQIVANELFECSLTGQASELYGALGPNLISCKLSDADFSAGVSHFDVKDSIFLNSQIRKNFDRIMVTQSAFRNVLFAETTMNDTVFVDSMMERVEFIDCDLSVATFKSNVFRECTFIRCKTSNKLFEHCLFYHCRFSSISLQEISILQNYGIQLSDTSALTIYRSETGESIQFREIAPKSRLESISRSYFFGLNLNESDDLLETVQLRLSDANKTNILHVVTGIRQLTSFLLFLYQEGRLLLYFPLQLFWSIDRFLESYSETDLPINVLEALQVSSARLRRTYEEACLTIAPANSYHILVREGNSAQDLNEVIAALNLDVRITRFERFNSPSLAEVTSPDTLDLLLFVTLLLSTRFRAEVDRYQSRRKLLDIGTRLIGDGKKDTALAYQALVALNVPKLLYIRLTARVNISLLHRTRRLIVRLLEDPNETSRVEDSVKAGTPALKVLFLASNPPETERLRLDREVKEIDEALRASGVRERFTIEQVWAAGEKDLQDSLFRYKPDVVHLSAHGRSTGMPIWDHTARSPEVNVKTNVVSETAIQGLAQIFAIAGTSVKCLILNACHSDKAAEAIAKHVGCVIGMSEAISDDAAIRFAWSFYNSIAYGQTVKAAFDLALAQLALCEDREDHVPRLFYGNVNPAFAILMSSNR